MLFTFFRTDLSKLFHLWEQPYWNYAGKGKGTAVPLQAWRDPEGSRNLRFPDFMTSQDGGKVVSLTHRPTLLPRKYSWYSFLLESRPDGQKCGRKGYVTEKSSNGTIRNRTRDLPSCSGMSEPPAPPRAPPENSKVILQYCLLEKGSPLFYSLCEPMPTWCLM